MLPAHEYEELIKRLTSRFKSRHVSDLESMVRMVGIVFARPNSPLAKSEIVPQLSDWNFRSGNYIDFYFVGYALPDNPAPGCIEVNIPGAEPWLYNSKRFDELRREIEARTTWQYGGGCELLITNARFSRVAEIAVLDFSSTVCCKLDMMKSDQAIESIERLFESIFRFAESSRGADPTNGFSNQKGMNLAGSALKRAILSLLPNTIAAEYVRAEHFVVQDVSRR